MKFINLRPSNSAGDHQSFQYIPIIRSHDWSHDWSHLVLKDIQLKRHRSGSFDPFDPFDPLSDATAQQIPCSGQVDQLTALEEMDPTQHRILAQGRIRRWLSWWF